MLTDYSGPQLALLEISHWLDVILLLGLYIFKAAAGYKKDWTTE